MLGASPSASRRVRPSNGGKHTGPWPMIDRQAGKFLKASMQCLSYSPAGAFYNLARLRFYAAHHLRRLRLRPLLINTSAGGQPARPPQRVPVPPQQAPPLGRRQPSRARVVVDEPLGRARRRGAAQAAWRRRARHHAETVLWPWVRRGARVSDVGTGRSRHNKRLPSTEQPVPPITGSCLAQSGCGLRGAG